MNEKVLMRILKLIVVSVKPFEVFNPDYAIEIAN